MIECLPELLALHPMLHFVIVGGAGPEGATWLRSFKAWCARFASTIGSIFSARFQMTA